MRHLAATVSAAVLAAGLLSACGEARPLAGAGQPGASGCTVCHGDGTRLPAAVAPAPPGDTRGNRATTAPGVGAHQSHLTDGPLRSAVACSDCHTVPADTAHATQPLNLTFSSLAGGAGATYDAALHTCANYCHGATVAGGTNKSPLWTKVDGTQAVCGSCHGIPPPAPHPAVGSAPTACNGCHPQTVKADGTIDVAGGKHVNGSLELNGGGGSSCTACHGDANRTPAALAPAPPRDTQGNTATTFAGVGAHQSHLGDGPLRSAVACSDCHTVPTDTAHATQPLNLTFSSLAGGTGATYDAALHTCANYCHGATLNAGGTNKSPLWTKVDGTQAVCGSCHGIPPPAPHPAVGSATTVCNGCHPQTVKADGTIDVAGGKHVNGSLELNGGGGSSCTSCHGDATRTPAALAPAPPRDTQGNTATTFAGVGAHQKHLTGTTFRAQPIACTDCHTVPSDTAHASQPLNLTFSPLAGGASASYDAAQHTCANACHGAGLQRGSVARPQWTLVDGTQVSCGSCHGIPPGPSTHDLSVHQVSCSVCHGSGYSATAVAKATHIDGAATLGNAAAIGWVPGTRSCANACHGGETHGPWTP